MGFPIMKSGVIRIDDNSSSSNYISQLSMRLLQCNALIPWFAFSLQRYANICYSFSLKSRLENDKKHPSAIKHSDNVEQHTRGRFI